MIEVVLVTFDPRPLMIVRNEVVALAKDGTSAVDHVIVRVVIARVETVQVAIDMVAEMVVITIEIVSDGIVTIDQDHGIAVVIPDRDAVMVVVVARLDRPENWWTTRNY